MDDLELLKAALAGRYAVERIIGAGGMAMVYLAHDDLLDRTLGERIQVEVDLQVDAWPTYVDPHQLENAIVNLAVNARDAMDGTGLMRISTANVTLAANEIGDIQPGSYLRISDGHWWVSTYLDGDWRPHDARSLPEGLQARYAKANGKGKGKGRGKGPGQSVPAKIR